MKKLLSLILTALILALAALPVLAEEAARTEVTEAADAAQTEVTEAADAAATEAADTADAVEAEVTDAADTAEAEATEAAEEAEEEKETWADKAFENFKEAEWYVYAVVAALAVLGVAGVCLLGKKSQGGKPMSTRVMAEGAMMIAVATVLSMIKIIEMPFGGSVTLFSMLPIVLMSYRHGTKWGLMTAFAHSILQLIMGIKNVGYCATLGAQIACILLDYVVAFSVLGLASFFSRGLKNRTAGVCVGTTVVCCLRFVCHFLSGVFLWGSYKDYYDWAADMPTWLYSIVYNGNYMLLETIITVLGALILVRGAARLFDRQAA